VVVLNRKDISMASSIRTLALTGLLGVSLLSAAAFAQSAPAAAPAPAPVVTQAAPITNTQTPATEPSKKQVKKHATKKKAPAKKKAAKKPAA
jgi:Skp family chaperone for outer membrane proteins